MNSIIFKGTKDGISVFLPKEPDFNEIKSALISKVTENARFFESVKSSVTFKGRDLTEAEELELINIILEKTGMNIPFYRSEKENEAAVFEAFPDGMVPTRFYRGSLRSGQEIISDGSVVIIGDVNPGAVIKAAGNIIVMGALKGTAHAGAGGDKTAVITALNMAPVQLRIGDIITRMPEKEQKGGPHVPEQAYIENGVLYISPLV